ncbi:PREDICTED: sodium channel protein Nach-like [Papilio polytes]|uniref:sodium channel protein Nach-like n=1 Tax=Papilio polytes TaxID=76194 RepID=UPI0006763BC8|nr:PREDICTED: sodium channel protein Nach-like [Papilio polytes]
MKGNFKTLLRRFCLEGSVLGLKYFYLYPDPVSRCFWGITLFLSTLGACLLTYLLYQRFMDMPTHITIENQYEPVYNLPYPAITLCSPNQITFSAVEQFKHTIVNGNLTSNFDELAAQALGFNELLQKINFKNLQQFQDIITSNRYSVVNVISLLSQNCSTFLKRCFFRNKQYPCEELFEPVLTKLGVCCSFNSIYKFTNDKRNEKKPNFVEHKVKKHGYSHGLTVIADYDPNNAVDGTIQHAGATRVILTDWSEFPLEVESTLAHPGVEVFHIISATYTYCSTEVEKLPLASRNCIFRDEKVLPHFGEYHNTDCDLNCLIDKVEFHCQCLFFYVPNVSPHRVCNFSKIPCIADVKFHMTEVPAILSCGCMRDCVSRRYSIEHFTGNLQAVQHVVHDRYTGIVFNESTTVMHFYFPKTTFVRQKQETVISLINFFSNLGGVFGLCLGFSHISLFEICFYIYIGIKNYIQKRRTTRRRRRIGYSN